jgi:co-chaperonin GroES (HSP10)
MTFTENRLKNTSGLKPVGHAVLVEPYTPEVKASLIAIPEEVMRNQRIHDLRAILVEAGPMAWVGEGRPRALPGQKVMVGKFAGVLVTGTADGKPYRMINDNDIFCIIVEEA